MSVGVVMLVHTAFDRAEQVARHWACNGVPVVIHVDARVPRAAFRAFVAALADVQGVRFCRRHRCEWGTWGLVAASIDAATMMLAQTDVRHVLLTSGSCVPLRPVDELRAYLAARPRTDFIESATVEDVPWPVDGLDRERFTLLFPVSWRRHRTLFDALVAVQRRLGYRRRLPDGLVPHMGSQWWCLTRDTLRTILTHPDRPRHDRYFRRVWIPDESYFQTLARLYSTAIESRSLTLSKFDFQGKPHIFFDDHLPLLRRSDCFVARKIWRHADRLYDVFLGPQDIRPNAGDPRPGKIDRLFSKAVERRTRGRAGLYMQSRYPLPGRENGVTAGRYAVLHGLDPLFEGLAPWLEETTGIRMHGHLFAPDRAHFAGGQTVIEGALPDSARARDADPRAFLTSLVWNTRGRMQGFLFGPDDAPDILPFMVHDPNAQIAVVTGAWAFALSHADAPFDVLRRRAAMLQRAEADMLGSLRTASAKARIRVWSMADLVDAPDEVLRVVVDDIGRRAPDAPLGLPRMRDLGAFAAFLQRLKNAGMHPYLTGDVPFETVPRPAVPPAPRRYVAE